MRDKLLFSVGKIPARVLKKAVTTRKFGDEIPFSKISVHSKRVRPNQIMLGYTDSPSNDLEKRKTVFKVFLFTLSLG